MNEWIPTLVGGFINLILAVFVYGRLTQAVSDHSRRLAGLEKDGGKIWERLSNHGERIATLEGKVE